MEILGAVLFCFVLATSVVAIALSINTLAEKQVFFVKVKEGDIMFVDKGEQLHEILLKVQGWRVETVEEKNAKRLAEGEEALKEGEYGTEPEIVRGDNPQSLLENLLGIRWIGIYPFYKIHTYEFSWDSFEDDKDPAGEVSKRRIKHRTEIVDSLFFQYSYPIGIKGAELRTGERIDLTLVFTVRSRFPYTSVYKMKGDWFLALLASIRGATNDYLATQSLQQWRAQADKEGSAAGLTNEILKLNYEKAQTAEGETVPGKGVVYTTGAEIIAVHFEEWDTSAGDPEVDAALRLVNLREIEGEAEVKKASYAQKALDITSQAEADAIKRVGMMRAKVWNRQAKAADGAEAIVAQAYSEGIQEFKGTALALGANGSGNQAFVNASSPPPSNAPASPSTPPSPSPESPPTKSDKKKTRRAPKNR